MRPLNESELRLAMVTAQVIAKAEEVGLPDAPDKLGVTTTALRLLARSHLDLHDRVERLHHALDAVARRRSLNDEAKLIEERVNQIARVAIEGAIREIARQQGGIATGQIVDEAKSEGMLAAKPFIGEYLSIMADAHRLAGQLSGHLGNAAKEAEQRSGYIDTQSGARKRLSKPDAELRVVQSADDVAKLTGEELAALYCRVMRDVPEVFAKYESYAVRHWDGMDGCWTDCTGDVGRDEALRYWAEKTDGGTRHVAYAEIDYYRIFPGGTRMIWDGSKGREMHR